MKVLVSSLAAAGHVAAVAPLVRAAVRDGAQIRVVVDARAAPTFADLGVEVAPLPPMEADIAAHSDRSWAEAGALGAQGDVEGSHRVAVRDGFGAANARRVVPVLRDQLDDFVADLVVTDAFEPGAMIVAGEVGVPVALASWSVSSPLPEWLRLLVEGACAAVGSSSQSVLEAAATWPRFSPVPACLDQPPGRWPEPVRWHPSEHVPRANEDHGSTPLIYATLGTVVGTIPPLANRFLECLGHAVRALDVDCLVTVGNDAPIEAIDVPVGLRVERFVSHAEIMPSATVVVSHGGINTVLDAAACGTPQVVMPMQATDQHYTAQRVADFGAGVALPLDQQTPSAMESALHETLQTATFRHRAIQLRDEMAKLPTAEAAWRRVASTFA